MAEKVTVKKNSIPRLRAKASRRSSNFQAPFGACLHWNWENKRYHIIGICVLTNQPLKIKKQMIGPKDVLCDLPHTIFIQKNSSPSWILNPWEVWVDLFKTPSAPTCPVADKTISCIFPFERLSYPLPIWLSFLCLPLLLPPFNTVQTWHLTSKFFSKKVKFCLMKFKHSW